MLFPILLKRFLLRQGYAQCPGNDGSAVLSELQSPSRLHSMRTQVRLSGLEVTDAIEELSLLG